MTFEFLATLAVLGLTGAFVAGLLGVGGAIVMIPLLLYGPPLLGVGALDLRAVTGVTMAQVFAAAMRKFAPKAISTVSVLSDSPSPAASPSLTIGVRPRSSGFGPTVSSVGIRATFRSGRGGIR